MLAIHVVWSVAVPIGLAEALFPARREKPWLGPVVIVMVALFYLAGSAAVAVSTYGTTKFVASPAQLAGATFVAIAAIVTALILRRPQPTEGRRAPVAAWLVFTATFVAGSALMGCRRVAVAQGWSWVVCVAVLLAVGIMFVGMTVAATRERQISGRTRFALVAAGIAVYGCFGIQTDHRLHRAVDLPAHIGLLLFIVLVAAVAYRREAIPR